MAHHLLEERQYRSPTCFGPALGPRQGPDGKLFTQDNRRTFQVVTKFRSDPRILEKYTPPQLELEDEPIVTLTCTYFTDIDWLAGRGYNMLGVRWRARHKGQDAPTPGEFLAVLWENKADPIITGREELGYPKIFADIYEPEENNGYSVIRACWEGFCFFTLTYKQTHALDPETASTRTKGFGNGSLQLKYLPGVGRTSHGHVAGVTLAPYAPPEGFISARPIEAYAASVDFRFEKAAWEEMPTQYPIVNALVEIPVLETLDSMLLTTMGGSDLGNTHILI